MTAATCRSCGAPIVWRTTPPTEEGGKPKPHPCDPVRLLIRVDCDDNEKDTTLLCEDGIVRKGRRMTDVAARGMPLGTYTTGRVSHFATCPNAQQHRRG